MLYIGEISPTRCNNCVFYSCFRDILLSE